MHTFTPSTELSLLPAWAWPDDLEVSRPVRISPRVANAYELGGLESPVQVKPQPWRTSQSVSKVPVGLLEDAMDPLTEAQNPGPSHQQRALLALADMAADGLALDEILVLADRLGVASDVDLYEHFIWPRTLVRGGSI
jgi:hypothetical protein